MTCFWSRSERRLPNCSEFYCVAWCLNQNFAARRPAGEEKYSANLLQMDRASLSDCRLVAPKLEMENYPGRVRGTQTTIPVTCSDTAVQPHANHCNTSFGSNEALEVLWLSFRYPAENIWCTSLSITAFTGAQELVTGIGLRTGPFTVTDYPQCVCIHPAAAHLIGSVLDSFQYCYIGRPGSANLPCDLGSSPC